MESTMSAASIETPLFDRTARKAHQWSMVALVAAGLILQGIPGALLLTVAGLIMLAGRFWWPADVVRQLVWRVLERALVLAVAAVTVTATVAFARWWLGRGVAGLRTTPADGLWTALGTAPDGRPSLV